MALTRDKRNLLFAVGALLAFMALFQFISYDLMITSHGSNHKGEKRGFARRGQRLSTVKEIPFAVQLAGKMKPGDLLPKPVESVQESPPKKRQSQGEAADLQLSKQESPPARCNDGSCTFFDITINSISAGRIVFLLNKKQRPMAAENFRALSTGEKGVSKSGTKLHYKGTTFSRIVHNILVQGGDIHGGKAAEEEKESIYGQAFKYESLDELHAKGLLAMAGLKNGGSEFFITLDSVAELDNTYVVFGEVVQGMDVVDRINNAKVNDEGEPVVPIVISDCGELTFSSLQANL